jgi:hypothetical protein
VNGLNVFGIPTAGSGQSRVSACGMSHRRAHVAMPITGELQGWQFRVDVIAAGLRISASSPGASAPAVWVVTR